MIGARRLHDREREIGPRRELKRALESYWAGRSDAAALESTAAELRAGTWTALRAAGLDHIPSNTFSFYDHVQSGQLVSRANSDIRSVEMFLAFAPTVAIQLVTFFIALVLMLKINVLLTLITLLPLPGVWYFGQKMRRQMFPVSWIVQTARISCLPTPVPCSWRKPNPHRCSI